MDTIRQVDPNTPIIGDAKRGDIGQCSLAYVRTVYDLFDFDAVTASPYMGYDSLAPFIVRKDKCVFVLCRTSNPGGKDLQDLKVISDDDPTPRRLYEVVAQLAQSWNENNNVGLVMGATYPDEIRKVRAICPDMLFLIPGIGAQGGDLRATVCNSLNARGSGILINVSRQIMYRSRKISGGMKTDKETIKAMKSEARNLRDDINRFREMQTTINPQSPILQA